MRAYLDTLAYVLAFVSFPLFALWNWRTSEHINASLVIAVLVGVVFTAIWRALPRSITGWK